MKSALEAPDASALKHFLEFAVRFRRLSAWNARMVYIQRPGSAAVASEMEWQSIGRWVSPDASPILILWPFAPIRYVYEIEDTGPPIDRTALDDPFAVDGTLPPGVMKRLQAGLAQQKRYRVDLVARRLGYGRAGSAASRGELLAPDTLGAIGAPLSDAGRSDALRRPHHKPARPAPVPVFRVILNEQMTEPEQFVTAAHELGHIFCGHVGPCRDPGRNTDDESGWPDRSHLDTSTMEIEAESVAFLVASRAGLMTASAAYLHDHVARAATETIDLDMVVRAASRIERLAKLSYGHMSFRR